MSDVRSGLVCEFVWSDMFLPICGGNAPGLGGNAQREFLICDWMTW